MLVRPAAVTGGTVDVEFTLIISQLISLEEREQFMTVKVWLPQIWHDERLRWDPASYGNVEKIQLPGDAIWRPELVLYNNADGNYEGKLDNLINIEKLVIASNIHGKRDRLLQRNSRMDSARSFSQVSDCNNA